MPRLISKTLVAASIVLAAAACGYNAGTTFNSDGSVTVSLKFLFPQALMSGGTGGTVTGLSPADINKANKDLAVKYPGGKVRAVTEGDETGAEISIPFKTEKEAFTFLTSPTKLSPSASGSSAGIDLSNTGGIFTSATHTTSGSTDTYTFKTQPSPISSAAPGSSQAQQDAALAALFTITFTLTVPHEMTSASGALFTFDRKTAVWKMSLTAPQTLTATTGGSTSLTANSVGGTNPALLLGVGLVAIAIGFLLGMFTPVRRLLTPAASHPPMMTPPPAVQPIAEPAPNAWGGPPPNTPPPAPPAG